MERSKKSITIKRVDKRLLIGILILVLGGMLLTKFDFISFTRNSQKSSQAGSVTRPISTSENVTFYHNVIDEINQQRATQGLSALEINSEVCQNAQYLAEESEKTYNPETSKTALLDSKKYLKDYLAVLSIKNTTADPLVMVLTKGKGFAGLSEAEKTQMSKYLDQTQLTNFSGSEDGQAMITNSKIKYGCVAMSNGKVGFKPFAFFVTAY